MALVVEKIVLLPLLVWCCCLVSLGYSAKVSETSTPQYAPVVQLSGGKVRGVVQQSVNDHTVFVFQGLRYGKAVRFAKPHLADSWNEVYNATHRMPSCPQSSENFDASQEIVQSEDCLFLNVWTTQVDVTNKAKPVIVLIQGNGNDGVVYDGRYLATHGDVVVVTVQYRLGALGFLYGGSGTDAPGNLAFHDLIQALRWLHDNIPQLGGDANRLTIVGEPAMIATLVISNRGYGLFKRAIMLPSSESLFEQVQPTAESLKLTTELAHRVNCKAEVSMQDTLKCLRTKPVSEIVRHQNQLNWKAIYSGLDELIKEKPEYSLILGRFNYAVDLMVGLGEVLDKSAASNSFDCATAWFETRIAELSHKTTKYTYRLPSKFGLWSHQLYLLFALPDFHLTEAQTERRQLAEDIMQAFTSFVKTGNPGNIGTNGSAVEWTEAYSHNFESNETLRYMSLDPKHYQMVNAAYKKICSTFLANLRQI